MASIALGSKRFGDRKSTRLNYSHSSSSYAVFCLKKKNGRDRPSQTNKLRYSVPPHSWSLKKWGMPISLPHIISDPRQFVRRIFISASQRPHNGTFVALA